MPTLNPTTALEWHRAFCGFYANGRRCSLCYWIEKISPSAEVEKSPSGSSVATSANSSDGESLKQPL